MKYVPELQPAILLRRYKRFLADVELENGQVLTVHTSNTGRMLGCSAPGSRVWIRDSQNPKRKCRYSWELASTEQGVMVGVNTHLANHLVREAIEQGKITELSEIRRIQSEVAYGLENSRIDLLLEDARGQHIYVEIKNVTASLQPGTGHFPDAVTARGTKHLRELSSMVEQGHRAVIFFCVARSDLHEVQPADEIDAVYGQTLREVLEQGVEAIAYAACITPEEIILDKPLPVVCP